MKAICKAAADDAATVAAHLILTSRAQTMRGPAQIARAAVRLCEIAARLQTIHVDDCNIPDGTERRARASQRLVTEAAAIVRDEAGAGYGVREQGDPRGWPLYIVRIVTTNAPEGDGRTHRAEDVCGISGRYGNRY